jgi:hypothetical protein
MIRIVVFWTVRIVVVVLFVWAGILLVLIVIIVWVLMMVIAIVPFQWWAPAFGTWKSGGQETTQHNTLSDAWRTEACVGT